MNMDLQENHTLAVQDTCHDAAICKLSAIQKKYFPDRFMQYFVSHRDSRASKMPLINRGTYARMKVFDQAITSFLDAHKDEERVQILVLGSGHDTLALRLLESQPPTRFHLVDIDFPCICRSKIQTLMKHKECYHEVLGCATREDFLSRCSADRTQYQSSQYSILGYDLRHLLTDPKAFHEALCDVAGLETHQPTLMISECVLMYIDPGHSEAILRYFSSNFPMGMCLVYEPILPHDAFGQRMVLNVASRGCGLKSIEAYPTLADQTTRFRSSGFQDVQCWDMNDIYYFYIDTRDRERQSQLELFDELEEYHLLQAHYCFIVAINVRRRESSSSPIQQVFDTMTREIMTGKKKA